ncbi:MAG TPA: Hsp70 family protein [Bryobacteraceae bacterium]|jgi:molecular chaperone DnaK (HSP70)|nr:Hsp70 family protein [Bryobacteraceae bacterium]
MKVGIDLGTTNSALAWIDPEQAEDTSFPPIHIFDIPQLVAPNRIEPRRTLPSFLLLEEGQPVGTYAREQGAIVPTRLVHSAKSWLSNADVDRTAKILPWDAGEGGRVLSPVEVSARFIAAFREAWDNQAAGPGSVANHGALADQEVVLTVPASFDEEARELTVKAAAEAGLPRITLLEEPAAAFYSWIANNLARSRKALADGQIVLVCDVGGGTTDFSLIRVSREGDKIDFTRTAVGKHLLLGGDNLDLTLAWLAESKIGKQLSIRQRSGLRRQCSAAKEILLCDPRRHSVEINVLGGGSSIIGGTLKTEITRDEALELTLEGFLPLTPRGEKPKEEKRSLFRELGLPYVSDPAVSRHLAAFLESAGQVPDAILFNGGFFIPEICRTRVADILENWYGRRPEIFENRDLDLAVASGAAYYSYVKSTGSGVLVRGGLPRAYYVGLNDNSAVCLVPRGAEEGDTVEVDREDLQLVANKPVAFRLISSLTRTDDKPGQVVEFAPTEEIHQHAPLEAVIRFGKGGERLVPVKLGARLTETGTLETWCDSKVSDNRWRLQFQLRKSAPSESIARRPGAVVSQEAVDAAIELVRETFLAGKIAPEELPSRLETALGLGRNSWPVDVARRLADVFIELIEGRKRTAAHEVRWLNLAGFLLRPGFGYIGDDFRIEQVRRIYAGGPQFGNQAQNEIDWWIFWGRLAGGLNRNQQGDIAQRLLPFLLPKPGKKPQRINNSLLREMWRTASSMELLPAGNRMQLGDFLIKQGKEDYVLWCLSRLGARQLFYGPANQVLAPSVASRWIEALINIPKADDALVSLARRTGDPVRDVSATTFAAVRGRLADSPLVAQLDGDAERDERALGRIFGEDLPSGLVLGAQ